MIRLTWIQPLNLRPILGWVFFFLPKVFFLFRLPFNLELILQNVKIYMFQKKRFQNK